MSKRSRKEEAALEAKDLRQELLNLADAHSQGPQEELISLFHWTAECFQKCKTVGYSDGVQDTLAMIGRLALQNEERRDTLCWLVDAIGKSELLK